MNLYAAVDQGQTELYVFDYGESIPRVFHKDRCSKTHTITPEHGIQSQSLLPCIKEVFQKITHVEEIRNNPRIVGLARIICLDDKLT